MVKAKNTVSNKEKTAEKKLKSKAGNTKSPTGKKKSEEKNKVAKIQEELAESKDKYLRLYSEFENFRRRTAKEKLEMVSMANEGLILSLLPIMDDFERADRSFSDDVDKQSIKEGVDLIYGKFKSVLEQKGVKKIDADKGAAFDVTYHEAITQIPAPKDNLKGKVVDVIESGYQINDKVIRFAKVVTGA